MREIKFRAWDKVLKKMGDVACLNLSEFSTDHILREKTRSNLYNQTFNNLILMQFTGLLDKNGKEIYEGDIVKYREGEYGKFYICEVKYLSDWGKYMFVTPIPLMDYELCGSSMTSEVIGDIYSNPELLRSDK